jgi:prevent-host-death family protein
MIVTMSALGISSARSNWADIVSRVTADEEIVITGYGRPGAKMIPISHPPKAFVRKAITESESLGARMIFGFSLSGN